MILTGNLLCLCLYSSVLLSFYLSVYLSLCLYVSLSVSMSFCLSIFPSFRLFVFLSFCLSVFLSFCLSVFLSLCLYVFLSFSVSISLFLAYTYFLNVCLFHILPPKNVYWKKFVCKTPNFCVIFYFLKNKRAFETTLVGKMIPAGTGLGSTVLDFWTEHILEIYFVHLIFDSFHFRKCLPWIEFLNIRTTIFFLLESNISILYKLTLHKCINKDLCLIILLNLIWKLGLWIKYTNEVLELSLN
jgi:hypothetical protein